MLNIVFPSVGRRVELIRAFKKAYLSLGIKGDLIGTDIDPLAPALQEVDQSYITPPLYDQDYLPTLLEICRLNKVGLLFPLIDPEVMILARNRSAFNNIGTMLAVVSEDAAVRTIDKWETLKFFKILGLSVPPSWLPEELVRSDLSFPLFIKPRVGSAGKSAFRVDDLSGLEFFIKYVPNPIIQEYIDGVEITNDVICDLSGDVLGIVSRRRIEVRWGEVAKGVTIKEPIIWEGCDKIARALPAIGPITVQCILKDGLPYYTEINARLGGGAPLAIAAGVDFPSWLIARTLSLELNIPPIGSYDKDVYITRYDDSLFLNHHDLDEIRRRHI